MNSFKIPDDLLTTQRSTAKVKAYLDTVVKLDGLTTVAHRHDSLTITLKL